MRWLRQLARRWCGHTASDFPQAVVERIVDHVVDRVVDRVVEVERVVHVDRPVYITPDNIPGLPAPVLGRFRVLLSGKVVCATPDGAVARRFFERLPLTSGQQATFWDGDAQRGVRSG